MITVGQNEGPEWPKEAFPGETVIHLGFLLAPYLVKVGVFRCIFEGLALGWCLVLLLEAHGSQNVCFLRWLTFTEHGK